MSDSSDENTTESAENIRPRRTRKSINSDDDENKILSPLTRSRDKHKITLSSDSDSSSSIKENVCTSDGSSNDSVPAKKRRLRSKNSSDTKTPPIRGCVKGFVKDTYEPARDCFLQDNQSGDSSLEDWIASDNESLTDDETNSGDSPDSDDVVSEVSNELADDVDQKNLQTEAVESKTMGSDGEDDDISPSKKSRNQRIHSDDSESESELASAEITESKPEKKKRKRKHRRVIILPDSQDVDDNQAEATDESGSSGSSPSNEHMSDFIVDDPDSVAAEDVSEHDLSPHEEFIASSTKMMDHAQAYKVVMESMLLRALNPDYFETEEFRANPDIADAFRKVFDPLEALIQDMKSQAWRKNFADALQLTEFSSVSESNYSSQHCEACNRRDRYASFLTTHYGYRYDRRSLKPLDREAAESGDDGKTNRWSASAMFHVGKFCEQRAQLYHEALHYKLAMLNTCKDKMSREAFADESADAIIDELVVNDAGWIDDEYILYRSLLERTAELIRKRSHTNSSDLLM